MSILINLIFILVPFAIIYILLRPSLFEAEAIKPNKSSNKYKGSNKYTNVDADIQRGQMNALILTSTLKK